MNESQKPKKIKINTNGYAFAVILTLYQIMICAFYGFWFNYNFSIVNVLDDGQIGLVSFLIILAIIGFGLINAYLVNVSFTGMAMTLFILVLTFQQYFLTKAFWQKLGTSNPNSSNFWQDPIVFNKINFVNFANDRLSSPDNYYHQEYLYYSYSFVDAIACTICNIIAFASVIGRVRMLQVFWLTLVSTFIYHLNQQLLWRLAIFDIGFGMRIFIYGGFVGFITSLMLGREQTTINNEIQISNYTHRGYTLLGLLIQFCTFPCLVAGSLYDTSLENSKIFFPSILRMYLALVSSFLGAFSASAIIYRKIMIHDFILSALSVTILLIQGGIVYSSSANLNVNPGVPLASGFIMSFLITCYHAVQQKKLNSKTRGVSLSYFGRFALPGLFGGVLSGILLAVKIQPYIDITSYARSKYGQGGLQIAGIGISIASAIISGIIIGLIYKFINKQQQANKFVDKKLYRIDKNL